MSGVYGVEKFTHLEDKIYRMIEQVKRERQARELLAQEVNALRQDMGRVAGENERLKSQVERLQGERDTIKLKVEAMLDAISVVEPLTAEASKRA